MQVARFLKFAEELRNDENIVGAVEATSVFRYFDKVWFAEDGSQVDDAILAPRLTQTLEKGPHWRERNSSEAFFLVHQLTCVVRATFASPPRKSTRDRFARRLNDVLTHAMHAFDATHDSLTGLLNRTALEQLESKLIGDFIKVHAEAEDSAESLTSQQMFALLALDVDHFKQVNDTYGHIYGDIVLTCLAMRLECIARDIEGERGDGIDMFVARPSGEEFSVLLVGRLTSRECFEIAEQFRGRIGSVSLPSDEELASYPQKEILESVKIPELRDRTVTVSIGVACAPDVDGRNTSKVRSDLHTQADTALYYAKTGGRDTVRYFEDIITRFGSVLEHHAETNIITIDLGRNLGVTTGQEFLIYHPDFDGSKSFVHSDGRTKKRLGRYPRIPVGRIVVFDVQEEISFCRLAEYSGAGKVPIGARLDAVPLGSISHLIAQEYQLGPFVEPNLIPPDVLPELVKEDTKQNRSPFAGVFTLHDAYTLINDRGTAFANEVLAKLFHTMKDEFPPEALVSQLKSTEFAIYVSQNGKRLLQNKMQIVLDTASQKCNNLASFCAGYYCSDSASKETPSGDKSKLSPKHTLDYARYAATVANTRAGRIVQFEPSTGATVLFDSRKKRLYVQAAKDYANLQEIGIRNAYLENQYGLCVFEKTPRDTPLAIKAFTEATSLSPKDTILWCNLGLALFDADDMAGASEAFHRVFQLEPEESVPPGYSVACALSLHWSYGQPGETVSKERLLALLQNALENASRSVVDVSEEAIQEAIEDITAG